MATQGEFDYFKRIGDAGMRHATNKPWSDSQCGLYLMELGAMMALMPETGRLLDMGCGTGWTSVLFAKKGIRRRRPVMRQSSQTVKKLGCYN